MSQLGLFEHFAAVAGRHPDRVALIHRDARVSFGVLRERVGAASSALVASGVCEGDLVGLRLERSPDQVAATLGCFAAGAAVLPLPPSYPADHVRRTIEFADPKLVLDTEGLDELVASGAGLPPPTLDADPDRLAFVLSSSGSTGPPKLIARTHRSFFHRLAWTAEHHPLGEGELGCQKAHATTTHAIYELFEPLLAGVPSLIVPDDEVRDLERFWSRVTEHGVTRLLLVPSMLRASLDLPGFEAPGGLRVVVLMGEHVDRRLAERMAGAFPADTALYSIYGSTEASSALVADLRRPTGFGGELALGVPLRPEIRAFVRDAEGRTVGPGGEGRLYLAGPNLFQGYHRDPERTAAVLGVAADDGAPLYDTRDRVRVLDDGALAYLGRTDDFVKIRGFPVHLREVEAALRGVPGVDEAVALAAGAEGDAQLVGWVPASAPPAAEVLGHLRASHPPYMVPSRLVTVERWPRTPSGKIDRRALLERPEAFEGPRTSGPAGPMWSPDERAVADAWAEVLGRPPQNRDDSFFEAGGTSLNVYELVVRLRRSDADADTLSALDVYRAPTVAALAKALKAGPESAEASAPVAVVLRGAAREGAEPLFVVASAGGTLGAYERLTRALAPGRPVVGLQDPYLWGGRDLHEGFDAWAGRYHAALRERQPEGPYHLVAYSSAGAFGWELARRLRSDGAEVRALVLIEPVGLARETDAHAGRAFQAIWQGRFRRARVRFQGRKSAPAPVPESAGGGPADFPVDFTADVEAALRNRRHMLGLSALLELNTGRPYTFDALDLEDTAPDELVDALVRRVRDVTPEVDASMIRRLAAQYELQVRTQHTYRLTPLDVPVTLIEPRSPIAGLLPGVLRPYTPALRVRRLPVAPPTDRARAITHRFGPLATHYRSMRDEVFVGALARELGPL